MKKLLLLSTSILALFSAKSQINILWESRYNGTGNHIDRVSDMYVDAAGNVYVTGSSYSTTTLFDIVTIKYNSAGVQQWASVFNDATNGTDVGVGLVVDGSGNVYVAGSCLDGTNQDICVIKYNSAGAQQWQVYNGGSFLDEARDIVIDNAGEPIVVGGTQSSSTNMNFRTVKFNSVSGAVTWFQDFSNSTDIDVAIKAVVDASDNITVTGMSFNTGQDFNIRTIRYNSVGTQQWSTQYNHNSTINSYDEPVDIAIDGTGNTFVLGKVFNGAASFEDVLVVKYSVAGAVIDNAVINGPASDDDVPCDFVIDASNNIYVAGNKRSSTSAQDYFVAKFDNALTQLWIDSYNSTSNDFDEATSLAFDPTGSFLFSTGTSKLSNNDYFTIKYNTTTGARVWSTRFNGPSNQNDEAKFIMTDAAGNIYVSGDSRGTGSNYDFSTIRYCQLTTTITADEDTVCVGGTINFGTGGGSTVVWSPSTYLSCSNCATPIATLMSDVCYTVSTQDADGCIDLDTICVVANPNPIPVITPDGPLSFCDGGDVGLSVGAGFSTTAWNTGDSTVSILVDSSATYVVTVTDAFGCIGDTSATVTVFGLPTVSAGNDESHCPGDTSDLSASGAASYVWTPSTNLTNGFIPNPSAFPSVPGTYNYVVEGTDANGCKDKDTVSVLVFTLPVKPSLLVYPPDTLDMLFVSNYSSGLDWYQNGIYLPGAGSGQFFDMADTNTAWGCTPGSNFYNAYYTDSNGCQSIASDTITIDTVYSDDCYIGIKEKNNAIASHVVYPNPVGNGDLIIEFNSKVALHTEIIIVDMSGKLVYSRSNYFESGKNRYAIDMNPYHSGVYQVLMRSDAGMLFTERIIRE